MKRSSLYKTLAFALVGLGFSASVTAQSNINDLLAAGLDDAERFTTDYLAPVSEATVYSLAGSWLNTATAKPLGGFEISIVGSLAPFGNKDDKRAFVLNTAEYENLRFQDGSTSKEVATALGDIEGVTVVIEDENGLFSESFELPSGLGSEDINALPAGFLQGSVGLIKGTEVKVRFLPKIKADGAEVGLYGFGILHDFSSHLPAEKLWPVSLSGFIGYTQLSGTYDFTDTNFIDGENQRIDSEMRAWTFQAVVSTRLPVINFYGSLGYISGSSDTDILGTYVVTSGPFQTTYVDPFSISEKFSGASGSVGAKLKLGFFRLHAEYSVAAFDTFTVGMHFGMR
ncbi:hypothetical protein SAMN04490243_2651 [Robiginitalea myxolifaciens]|uniref:Outer membrane protein beta-barrel domain-containing protein n=1 Tax=Robiginitalea myxolifaciens TaxID=400055 RepID=A0A1I6HEK0_9FLAO|nr:DUF6588 family protein [Robiginitalea myxolifaciens]SFR52913.1 hypothetical protein SAMN04490243_2651 [Robiginitalea myxolifaciens]